MPPIDFTRRTALYRFFDAADRLLYVGIAFDPEARWKDHEIFKLWWPDVARRVVEWHGSRTEALAAEATAIRTERPLYNIRQSNVSRSEGPRPHAAQPLRRTPMKERVVKVATPHWDAYAAACEAKGISRSDDLRMHIKREIAAHQRRLRAES